jgi:hypothetical protein
MFTEKAFAQGIQADKVAGQAIQAYTDSFFTQILNPLIYAGFVFTFIFFLYFAAKSLLSAGQDVGSIADSRRGLLWGIIGLTIMTTAIAITWFIGNTGNVIFGSQSATDGLSEVQYIKIGR